MDKDPSRKNEAPTSEIDWEKKAAITSLVDDGDTVTTGHPAWGDAVSHNTFKVDQRIADGDTITIVGPLHNFPGDERFMITFTPSGETGEGTGTLWTAKQPSSDIPDHE